MTETSNTFLKVMDLIAASLLAAGGLNWGLIALFDFNLVAWFLGSNIGWIRVIYALVGLSALYDIFFYKIIQRRWGCGGFYRRVEGSAV